MPGAAKVCRSGIRSSPEISGINHQNEILMNKKATTRNGRSPCQVRFDFNDPQASEVFTAGTFNDWEPQATRMLPMGNGQWGKILVLPPGTYEYRFVADGQWMADPRASRVVPNPFGGLNSVLEVGRRGDGMGAKRL